LIYLCLYDFYEEANKVFDKLENILDKKKFIKYLQKIDNKGNCLFNAAITRYKYDDNKIMYNKFLNKILDDKYIGKYIGEINKLLVIAFYSRNEYAITKLINKKNIDLAYINETGDTYLILAIKNGIENIAEILINTKKIDLNHKNSENVDALFCAERYKMIKIIILISKYLKKSEIDIMYSLKKIPYGKLMKYENILIVQKALKNNRNYQILNTKLKELSKIDTCPVCMDDKIITIPTECCHYYCKNCYIDLIKCAICGYRIINNDYYEYDYNDGMQMGDMQIFPNNNELIEEPF